MRSHVFDIDVAIEYGVDEAIMIQGFQYWISLNASHRRNYHDGKYWTYNTYKSLAELFPYFSVKQIRRVVASLVDKNILCVDTFNKRACDKTSWYAFVDEVKWLRSKTPPTDAQMGMGEIHMGSMNEPKRDFSSAQMGNTLPYNNTSNNPITISSPNGEEPVANSGNAPGKSPRSQKEKNSAQKEKETTEHWQQLVDVWFTFYKDKKGMDPTFGGQEGKQLKEIINRLQKRATDKNKPWDEQSAKDTLTQFLKFAHQIQWLGDNFLLSNLLKQFDKIISDAINNKQPQQPGNNNGKGQQPISLSSVYQKLSQCNPGGRE